MKHVGRSVTKAVAEERVKNQGYQMVKCPKCKQSMVVRVKQWPADGVVRHSGCGGVLLRKEEAKP